MASINDKFSVKPPTDARKREIAEVLWGPYPIVKRFSNGECSQELNLDAYIRFYTSCIHAFRFNQDASGDQTELQILSIVGQIRNDRTREDIRAWISHEYPGCCSDSSINSSINLAAQLLMMVEFGANSFNTISGTTKIEWTHGTAKSIIETHFSHQPEPVKACVYLDQDFTAYNLENIAGIKITWTDNLADHLRLVDRGTKLAIFHHATFLECQNQENSLMPRDLAKETLRTISLLFPHLQKRKIQKYQSCTIDKRLLRCGYLRDSDRKIETFYYWRDRLVLLKEFYDEAHPRTINQWWRDRRNGVQWYTFWVAVLILVLTIFFGMVQSIEGALQVYKAYFPG